MIYTHLSDRYAPFHAKAMTFTVRDATHVLDGLLHQDPGLQIEEHYTDTSYRHLGLHRSHLRALPFTRVSFRAADSRSRRSSAVLFEQPSFCPGLRPLVAGRIHISSIRRHWDEVARFVASIREGSASSSLLVGKLAAYPRQTHLGSALREIGRIERTLFTLAWLQDPELRRRVTIALNKGEAHHTLKRAIRFYR